jgi:predicted transcriptional regulator
MDITFENVKSLLPEGTPDYVVKKFIGEKVTYEEMENEIDKINTKEKKRHFSPKKMPWEMKTMAFYIKVEQQIALQNISRDTKQTVSHHIRIAIDDYLQKIKTIKEGDGEQ